MRVSQRRMLKRMVMLAGVCLIMGLVLHYAMAPELAYDASKFNLEKELKLLPEDQRDAARAKWKSLSESRKDQARRISQRLTEQQKKEIIEQIQDTKTP